MWSQVKARPVDVGAADLSASEDHLEAVDPSIVPQLGNQLSGDVNGVWPGDGLEVSCHPYTSRGRELHRGFEGEECGRL